MIVEEVRRLIDENGIASCGIVAAVSGGPDSVTWLPGFVDEHLESAIPRFDFRMPVIATFRSDGAPSRRNVRPAFSRYELFVTARR